MKSGYWKGPRIHGQTDSAIKSFGVSLTCVAGSAVPLSCPAFHSGFLRLWHMAVVARGDFTRSVRTGSGQEREQDMRVAVTPRGEAWRSKRTVALTVVECARTMLASLPHRSRAVLTLEDATLMLESE